MSDMLVSRQRQEALDLLNLGEYAKAEGGLRAVVQQTEHQKNAESFMWQRRMVESLVGQGKFAEAEPIAWRALKGFEDKYGPCDEDALDCKYLLAQSLHGQMKYLSAQPLARSAFEGMEENLKRGPEHHTALSSKALCAVILQAQGHLLEAKELAQSTYEGLEAAEQKVDILASQGSRQFCNVELLGLEKTKSLLAKVLKAKGKYKDEKRHTSIETVSTDVPESGDEQS